MLKNSIDDFILADKSFCSRLIIGSGKYSSRSLLADSIHESGAEIVTTAIRRIDLSNPHDSFIKTIDPKKYLFLANTSGARNAEEAIRLAAAARASGITNWIKLEVIPDPTYLMPDPVETFKAAKELINQGFIVLPYIHADPVLAKKLEEIGCSAVMPLAAPIGSKDGLKMAYMISIIIKQSTVPVIIDAGIASPSDACKVMEMGADAVMLNTAIASAQDPILMSKAFKKAIEAGRQAFLSGLSQASSPTPSSPLLNFISS